MNGVVLIHKEKDYTSFDVVAVVRKLLGQKKVGHTGTLDPNATGILPVLLGTATKAQDVIPCHDKKYRADFRFGLATDTLDIWGKVTEEKPSCVSREQLEQALARFRGEIEQLPPMYSAVSIDGKRLYQYAREGKEVERKTRRVTVYELELISFDEGSQSGTLDIYCSNGTYIRTIIDDLARALGTVGVMTDLVRYEACGYRLEDAITRAAPLIPIPRARTSARWRVSSRPIRSLSSAISRRTVLSTVTRWISPVPRCAAVLQTARSTASRTGRDTSSPSASPRAKN